VNQPLGPPLSPRGERQGDGGQADRAQGRPPGDGAVNSALVAAALLGCLLFSYPLLALFNVHATVFGVPLLYFYLFCDWAALIVLIRWAVSRAT
jgi:hypothetical protein